MGEREDKATNNREQSAKGGEGPFLEKRAKKQKIQMKFIIYSSYLIFKLIQIITLLLVFNQHPSNSILTRSSSTDFMKTAIQPFPFSWPLLRHSKLNKSNFMNEK